MYTKFWTLILLGYVYQPTNTITYTCLKDQIVLKLFYVRVTFLTRR